MPFVNSLRKQILVATFGTIIFFLVLAGIALDKAFQRNIRGNISDQLQNLTFSLLASADIDINGKLVIPKQLPQSDITIPESGLIALIVDERGKVVWRSPSSLGENLPIISPVSPGISDFQHNKYNPGEPFIYRFGSVWGNSKESDKDRFLTFVVLQYKTAYRQQIQDYRETIVQWLGGGSLLILLVHGIFLLRALRPLKQVVKEIDAIEHGDSNNLKGIYPTELMLLTNRINQFIHNEREQLTRYRHGLDDLAHSLKTPLAVISGLEHDDGLNAQETRQLSEQISRMTEIIDYQLKRAASAGRNTLGIHQTLLQPVIEKTLSSLDKVYADKGISHQINCNVNLKFPGDKDDLYEIVGNTTDNAYKWAHNKVHVSAKLYKTDKNYWLAIVVEDDGPGFSLQSEKLITERGVKADEQVPGQGIGLAVVQNIVRSYSAVMRTDKSHLGGALVELIFPMMKT